MSNLLINVQYMSNLFLPVFLIVLPVVANNLKYKATGKKFFSLIYLGLFTPLVSDLLRFEDLRIHLDLFLVYMSVLNQVEKRLIM